MPFVKETKCKSYFSRYQTKYSRRRACKTDYKARRHLIAQDKNKYNSPRYRLVVRMTNRDVVVQVTYAKLIGDEVLTAAYGHELAGFGAKVGTKNYPACYATGLLAARRLLTKLGLATKYQGNALGKEGENFDVEALSDGPRPFKALLDVGLVHTSTGNRCFAAMKGAVDGGLNVPHSAKRFPGYDKEKGTVNSETLRARLFGMHIAQYQESLKSEDKSAYDKLFSRYSKAGINPGDIEGMWKTTVAAIRKDPTRKPKAKRAVKK
jgi:large subunit ribosomal protein L5e